MSSTGQDAPPTSGKLGEALLQSEAELQAIEEILGLERSDEGDGKEAQYGDVPRRLNTLIKEVNDQTGRLSRVRGAVVGLKEAVG